MTLRDLLDYYDDWNGYIKVNNRDLDASREVKVSTLVEKGNYLSANIMAFGFYDGQLCVRLDTVNL